MEIPNQTTTYQIRQRIRRAVRITSFKKNHFIFIKNYLKSKSSQIILLISLLLFQVVIEITVLMFASGSLRDRAYNAFNHGYLYILIGSVLIGIVIYLTVSFFALLIERKIVIGFINALRRSWYNIILRSSEQALTNERKADFIAKATYHFPLISLGIDNSALGTIRWSLSACVLLAVGSMGGNSIFLMSLGLIVVSVVVGMVGYFIANHYVTREVASYSQVVKNISNNLSEFSLFKTFRREYDAMNELDARVDIDTYFRIRRDLWLRYFNKVIYAFIFISSFCLIIIGLYYPEVFSRFYSNESLFLISLLSIYSLRLLYEAGRTGLYLPPLRLGLLLSIPESILTDLHDKSVIDWSTLEFISNKTKLHNEGSYFKRLNIHLDIGKRYLFFGDPYIGKTSLAEILAGKARFNRNGWLVKLDNSRLEYRNWLGMNIGSYYISSYFTSEKTVGEIIFAKDKKYISSEDLSTVYRLAEKYELFAKIISKKRFIGESLRSFETNKSLLFSVYVLHCLVSRPNIIIIDNHWIDLNYLEINELLRLIDKELPESTIIYFSRANNDIISYNNKYEIQKENIISL